MLTLPDNTTKQKKVLHPGMDGFAGDLLSDGRALLGEDSSVMARMQKKFWKTKQVLIKVTGKKEDEHVVASDADLDAKLEFFRSVQFTCTELLKVIEKYQHRITRLSQEENELGLFLRFQSEHDRTKAGKMMDATSKALCTSAKQRMALCPPLQRMHQEVETFRRRAIADTLLTVTRMEKSRTEYRGALLWMKDVSQELDPDTYKELEKFRKVQAQVRETKSQFDKLKNDVCQKVDMLGASRCNMLSHSLCTYQTTLLQYWEKTAHSLSGIHEAFLGHVPYQFTTIKELRDPLEQISDLKNEEKTKKEATESSTDTLMCLDEDNPAASSTDASLSGVGRSQSSDAAHQYISASADSGDDLMLMALDMHPPTNPPTLPQLPPPCQTGGQFEHSSFVGLQTGLPQLPVTGGGLPSDVPSLFSEMAPRPEDEDSERSDMAFLKDLLSPGLGSSDEFNREWQDAFGIFESPATPATSSAAAAAEVGPPSNPPSPTGFLPSQLLDHSLSSTGWVTPPMFQAPPLQPPAGQNLPAPRPLTSAGGSKDMSAWFNLFADLDPLSNPDAIGRSADELLNA
ncbi:islet cell autoantigen 1-like isoform X2 [Oryzias melastigma]|uniref:islet cell autoantigen 1-like isoform X2 n=1 Tax=Oryzias melastigma TaxID=30732 RepID=UPI000CF7B7E1|nr:islet cell autoantigen 1-like isoform X2 [Oryzias melastigma]